jgi:hypothetical protein
MPLLPKLTAISYDFNAAIYHWIKTKSDIWRYEEEVRILFTNLVLKENNKFLFEFDKRAISEIYLGSKMLPEEEKWIKEFCNENLSKIKLFKMTKPLNLLISILKKLKARMLSCQQRLSQITGIPLKRDILDIK